MAINPLDYLTPAFAIYVAIEDASRDGESPVFVEVGRAAAKITIEGVVTVAGEGEDDRFDVGDAFRLAITLYSLAAGLKQGETRPLSLSLPVAGKLYSVVGTIRRGKKRQPAPPPVPPAPVPTG